MPWHRLGTVSVTQNSSTVTGVNTAFAANTRIGDAFIGPDGRQYELGNVASDTVISIIPPYLGPTVAGAAYAVTPVQGYQKGLADQVRDWVNTYGPKMAGLGSTGNYDILPVAKGGTGGTDQAAARSGLGLGSSATAALQTSATDAAPGRVLTVGGFGLGSTGVGWPADLNAITAGQFFGWGTGTTSNVPIADFGEGIHMPSTDPSTGTQLAFSHNSNRAFYRRKQGGTWQAWVDLLTSESGSYGNNANGTFYKLPDGTMICTRVYGAVSIAAGATLNLGVIPFAATFTGAPVINCGVSSSYPYDVSIGVELGVIGSSCKPSLKNRNATVTISDIYIQLTAIGRWR